MYVFSVQLGVGKRHESEGKGTKRKEGEVEVGEEGL